jgi:arylsulfatase A-like enzyme
MATRKSIVLITIDCLRADHCGFMGYERPTTPSLDELAAESFVFPAAIAAGVPTYYSVPAILASRSPLVFGREVLGLVAGEQGLASVLKRAGYATAFIGAANPYLSSRFGYDFGFDNFQDFLDGGMTSFSDHAASPTGIGWTRRLNRSLDKISHRLGPLGAAYDDLYFQYCQRWASPPAGSLDALRRFPAADVIVDHAAKWFASLDSRPCFLWLHVMDPHSPYYPTEKGQELLGEKKRSSAECRYLNACWNRSDLGPTRLRQYKKDIISLYDSAVRWVDAQVARLIEIIRQRGWWENCIFALTADHGEEFLEHNGRYHAPSSLSEELIRVPLLLRVGGVKKRELSSSPFSLLHLAPTLLDAAELSQCREFQGRSHWAEILEGRSWTEPAIAECIVGCSNPFRLESRRGHRILAVRETRYKLILNFEKSTEQLFDLEIDPAEKEPLRGNAAGPVRRRLLQAVFEYLNRPSRRDSLEYLRSRLRDIEPAFPPLERPAATNSASAVC